VPALNVHRPDKPSRAAGRGRNTAGTFDSSVAAASHTEVAANLANQNTFQERSLPAGKMPGYTPQTGNFANLDIATRNEPLAGKRQGSSIARGWGVMSDQDKDKSAKDARRGLFLEEGGRFPRCFAQDWNHSGGVVARC
jgi:hypothetical protein